MCRLFGLTAGHRRVSATFWLLDAQDSLRSQSHRNPDGTGLGTFDEAGRPVVEKQPLAGFDDAAFVQEARERTSSTFVGHVRKSSGTPISEANTHPFTMAGRIFAHNGVIGDVPRLEAELGPRMSAVRGDTDSERFFALITREIEAAGGDIGAGIASAVGWIAANLPVLSANFVLTTPDELWALRWPDTHELWLLDRRDPAGPMRHRSGFGTRVHSDGLADAPSLVVASERLDDDAWTLLPAGTLLHVDAALTPTYRDLPGPRR